MGLAPRPPSRPVPTRPQLPAAAARSLGAGLPFLGLLVGLLAGAPSAAAQPAGDAGDSGDLASGPYDRLVIRGAMVIPGHGGPPTGPYDIVVRGDSIAEMHAFDADDPPPAPERPDGERVIEASGDYVMPGMIDLHHHLRQEPLPLRYVYYLKLAHGVTTAVPSPDRGLQQAEREADRAREGEILAPEMYPIWGWGDSTDYSRSELEDPSNAPGVARAMAERGAHVVYLNDLGWKPELFDAVADAVEATGGVTGVHLPPSTTAMVDAVDAARMGVTMILHHYGYAESALERSVQDFPPGYQFSDELERFRQAGEVWSEAPEDRLLGMVADSLAAYGVAMLPTRVVYEANRDILRARSLPWHEKYTHRALIELYLPSRTNHGAYFYDWTSEDEQAWYEAFDLWGDLIYEFNERGGRVAYGTDDAYIWATPGFSTVRELQLVREAGLHPLEVLKSATRASAEVLRRPDLGLVRPGYEADLVLVDGNPARNLRFLYSFGALTTDDSGKTHRTGGIVHTISDGVVVNNDRLMEEVARMVRESKQGAPPTVVDSPFVVRP